MTYQIVSERKLRNSSSIKGPDDVFYLLRKYAYSKQEQFILVTLDASHRPIRIILLGIGTINRAIVHPREVFHYALKDLAMAVLICHNHPSGLLSPSYEDLNITKRLIEAGEIMGIPIIDHLIINKKTYFSFKKENIIESDNKYNENTDKEIRSK
jgi:DNA repair protein RadC